MRKSIRKILKEELSDDAKAEELQQIWESLNEGYFQLEESWGFDEASQALEDYFETGGVTLDLRDAQQSLNTVFKIINSAQKEAKNAINSVKSEINRVNPLSNDTPVGNDGMDEYLRGGGAVGGL